MPRASGSIRFSAHHLFVTLDSSAAVLLAIPMVASWQPFVETPPNFFGIKAGDRLHFRRAGDNQLIACWD
jgi:hypothetical protein